MAKHDRQAEFEHHLRQSPKSNQHAIAMRAGLILWAIFTVIVVVVQLDSVAAPGGVVSIYREAAVRWLDGETLYRAKIQFLYLPTAAALASPLAMLPFTLAGIVMRTVNLVVFFAGARAFMKTQKWSLNMALALLAHGIIACLAWSAARHGQSTLLMAGLLMLAHRDLLKGRHWRGALYGCFAVAIKTLAVGPFAVLLVMVPRAILPSLAIGAAGLIACISPAGLAYTINQYQDYQYALDRFSRSITDRTFPQLVTLLEAFGVTLDGAAATALRVGFFTLVAGGTAIGARRLEAMRPGLRDVTVYGALMSALLLASPVTESNTYAALTPAIAIVLITALMHRAWVSVALAAAIIIGFLMDHQLGQVYGRLTKPACALVFCGWMWWRCVSNAIGEFRPGPIVVTSVRNA